MKLMAEKEDEEKEQMMMSMDRKRQKIKTLRRITVDYNIRLTMFKWRMTTVFMRLIDEIVTCCIDQDSFRILMR